MSEQDIDIQFRAIADSFIDLANQAAKNAHVENVGMAMLYAVSRFNAYVVASHADNLEKYESDVQPAMNFFMEKYQEMLQENFDDYKKVYDSVLKYPHLMKNKPDSANT